MVENLVGERRRENVKQCFILNEEKKKKKLPWRLCGAWWRQQTTEYLRNADWEFGTWIRFIPNKLSHLLLLLLLLSVLGKFVPNSLSLVCYKYTVKNFSQSIRCYVGKCCVCIWVNFYDCVQFEYVRSE